MAVRTAEDCRAFDIAIRMLRFKPKTSLVEMATGLSKPVIRSLYKSMHNESPISGPKTHSSYALMRDPQIRLQIMIFFHYYGSMYGDEIFRSIYPDNVLNAYEQYISSVRLKKNMVFNLNHAWVFAKDLRLNTIIIQVCENCSTDYPTHVVKEHNLCPICVKKGLLRKLAYKKKLNPKLPFPTLSELSVGDV